MMLKKVLSYVYRRISLEVILLLCFAFVVKIGSIWFSLRSLDHGVSGSSSPKQCWVWVTFHGVDLTSNQLLLDDTHKLCATIALAYVAGSTPM